MRIKISLPILWIYSFVLLSIPISTLAASGESRTAGPPSIIRAENNRLTVKLIDIPLDKVLTEIANQTGIQIIFYGPMEGLLSADFSDLPLDKGLRRLTQDFDHIFIYHPAKAKGSELEIKTVIIRSEEGKRPKKRLEPRVIESRNLTRHGPKEARLGPLVKALKDRDPEVREEAVDSLAELEDERVIVYLTDVLLNDNNEDVRGSAAEALGDLGDERAVDPLIQALRDKDAGVRESAINALAEIGSKEAISPLKGPRQMIQIDSPLFSFFGISFPFVNLLT
jgi:hypothetical protein